jgi:hypothetical protein
MTINKQILPAIIPKFTGLASILGSSYIIYSLIGTSKARKEKLDTTFNRFLLILSFYDIISSSGAFLSTWTVPREPPEGMQEAVDPTILDYQQHFPWAAGTKATCTAQGFMVQLGTNGSVLFTAFISLQFVFSVRYQWSEPSMRILEKICYFIGILLPFGSSIYLAITNQLNPVSAGACYINQYPYVCSEFFYVQDPSIETWCTEYPGLIDGEKSDQSQLFFAMGWVGLVFIIVVVSMLLLYMAVRTQEQRVVRWSITAQQGRYRKKVIQKAMLFVGNYLFMYTPIMVLNFNPDPFLLDLLIALFVPLQGFLNALVYSNIAERLLCCECCCDKPLLRNIDKTSNTPYNMGTERTHGSTLMHLTPGGEDDPYFRDEDRPCDPITLDIDAFDDIEPKIAPSDTVENVPTELGIGVDEEEDESSTASFG